MKLQTMLFSEIESFYELILIAAWGGSSIQTPDQPYVEPLSYSCINIISNYKTYIINAEVSKIMS